MTDKFDETAPIDEELINERNRNDSTKIDKICKKEWLTKNWGQKMRILLKIGKM